MGMIVRQWEFFPHHTAQTEKPNRYMCFFLNNLVQFKKNNKGLQAKWV